ncbi:unnamed protein product [Phaeothamnion confervicola]
MKKIPWRNYMTTEPTPTMSAETPFTLLKRRTIDIYLADVLYFNLFSPDDSSTETVTAQPSVSMQQTRLALDVLDGEDPVDDKLLQEVELVLARIALAGRALRAVLDARQESAVAHDGADATRSRLQQPMMTAYGAVTSVATAAATSATPAANAATETWESGCKRAHGTDDSKGNTEDPEPLPKRPMPQPVTLIATVWRTAEPPAQSQLSIEEILRAWSGESWIATYL